MIRTQIQLPEDQFRLLKEIALRKKVSMAEVIRQSIEVYIHNAGEPTLDDKYEQLLSVVGKYTSNITDLSTNHDDYLAEIYAEAGT